MKLFLTFLAALFLVPAAALRADGQLTVLGGTGLQTWTSFPLQTRTFSAEQVQQPPEQWLLRLCESIDNSNLVVIGDFFPATAHQAVFSHPAVGKSLTAFWSRGGTLFWGLLSADIIISYPAVMSGFFKEFGIPFPTLDFYHDPGKGKDIALHGIPAPGYDGPLLATANQQPMPLTAVRHFGRLPVKTFKPVAVARENQDWPLIVMAENILGKGRIICNYCYDLSRETNHPFYANLVTLAYGPLARHSAKQTIRQRLQQAFPFHLWRWTRTGTGNRARAGRHRGRQSGGGSRDARTRARLAAAADRDPAQLARRQAGNQTDPDHGLSVRGDSHLQLHLL